MITAAHFKIFLNYSQTIAIINTLHLNWDSILLEFFNIHKTVSGGMEQVVSIECFIAGIKLIKHVFVLKMFIIRFELCPIYKNLDFNFMPIHIFYISDDVLDCL